MLILRGTAAFRARVPGPLAAAESSTTALGGWYANLVRRRRPLALLINERTLLPVLMPLAPAKTLAARFPAAAAGVLSAIGIPDAFIGGETAAMQEVRLAPTADRRVVGVLTDMIRWLDFWDLDGDPDLLAMSLRLADRPSGALQYFAPDRQTRVVVEDLGFPVAGRTRQPARPPVPPDASSFPTSVTMPDGRTVQIQHQPGLANELLEQMRPLLAADGIDLDDPETMPDRATLQAGLDRASERHNQALFTPVGARRTAAVTLLRQFATAIAQGDDQAALDVLDRAQPESRDDRIPEVSAVIGAALGLVDEWLSGRALEAPKDLAAGIRVPKQWRKVAKPAAEILALGTRDRAAESLGALIARQGGRPVLAGAMLAVALSAGAWAPRTGTPLSTLLPDIVR